MQEWCVENPESIKVDVSSSQCAHQIKLEEFLRPSSKRPSALLILNQKIDIPQVFTKLWKNYGLRVCADGGANQLYDFFRDDEHERTKYMPDYIVGDLDSLRDDVYAYYESHGVIILRQRTQNSTDFSKCLDAISLHWDSPEFINLVNNSAEENHSVDTYDGLEKLRHRMASQNLVRINLLALGGINGRFDQTVHSISQLYKLGSDDSQFNLCYLSSTDLIFLVPAHGTLIQYTQGFRKDCIGNCGILPMGGPTVIEESRGLKWDIGNWYTSIQDGKVSSSNRFVGEDRCYLKTKESIVMNVEILVGNLKYFL
ncbi:THI80 (YOR143C) [Zygosaccharomyces parabailii]|nr:THI80 (YOR143C) [Zygosaccharomyces parabailii]CDH12006.1 related to Thiamine pyrophosphokinase [Zygosaccharomyces bailii ISA1307]